MPRIRSAIRKSDSARVGGKLPPTGPGAPPAQQSPILHIRRGEAGWERGLTRLVWLSRFPSVDKRQQQGWKLVGCGAVQREGSRAASAALNPRLANVFGPSGEAFQKITAAESRFERVEESASGRVLCSLRLQTSKFSFSPVSFLPPPPDGSPNFNIEAFDIEDVTLLSS